MACEQTETVLTLLQRAQAIREELEQLAVDAEPVLAAGGGGLSSAERMVDLDLAARGMADLLGNVRAGCRRALAEQLRTLEAYVWQVQKGEPEL